MYGGFGRMVIMSGYLETMVVAVGVFGPGFVLGWARGRGSIARSVITARTAAFRGHWLG